MKNPVSVPALIAIVVVAVVAFAGVGYHFVQDSKPILLQKDPNARGKGNKLSAVGLAAGNTNAQAPASPQ